MEGKITQITDVLSELGIKFTLRKHGPVMTCAEHEAAYPDAPGILTKNMLMKDKASKYFLIVSSNKKINTGELRKMVKAKKALRSTSSDLLMELLGVEAGAVTPLGLLADKEKKVTVVLDSELETCGKDIMVHPLTNTATVSLSFKSLMLFLEKTGHAPDNVKILDVPEKKDDQKPQKTQKPQKPQKPQKKKKHPTKQRIPKRIQLKKVVSK